MTERPAFAKPVVAVTYGQGWAGLAANRGRGLSVAPPAGATATAGLPLVAHRKGPALAWTAIAPLKAAPVGRAGLAVTAASASGLSVMLSSLAHAAVVTTAIWGGWSVSPLAEVTVEAASVSLVSVAQFQAMTAPQPAVAAVAAALAMPEGVSQPEVNLPLPEVDPAPSTDAPAAFATPLLAPAPDLASDPVPEQAEAPVVKPAPAAPKPAPKKAAEKPAPKPVEKAAEKKPEKAAQTPAKKPVEKPAAKAPAGAEPSVAKSGKAGNAKAAAPSQSEVKALKSGWGSKLRNRIERHKKPPKGAAGLSGSVKLRITVAPSGALLGVTVLASSGHEALDSAAMRAVKSAAPFAAAPKGLGEESYSFTLPIRFDG